MVTTPPARTAVRAGCAGANVWLRHWIPKILRSPAFRADGMLVITEDESDAGSGGLERLLR